MFGSMLNAWKIPELRKKLIFTAAMIVVYRFGAHIPVPGVDIARINQYINSGQGDIFGFLNLFSGGALTRFAVFALGIMPYITASIILQLLTMAFPSLKELAREGEAGQHKITQYTRYLTLGLALAQSVGYTILFSQQGVLQLNGVKFYEIVITLTAGTMLLMWIGELITQHGIGNGISLLIFASIVSGLLPGLGRFFNGTLDVVTIVVMIGIGAAVIAGIVMVQEGQRRINIQYAKRQIGRKMTTGGSTYLPLSINMAGVIPVIFASSVLMFPPTIAKFFTGSGAAQWFANWLRPTGPAFLIFESIFIIGFTYFYTAVQFDPVERANDLKKYGGFIPGIRPGRPTAVYLDRVLTRLTLPGAIFLAAIAVLPAILIAALNVPFYFGGTSILIVVGVALQTMKQMESQLLMRHYEGFLK
ncbi:MAG: preprotein translocase subunit SecY [Thermoleophilia bacterium]|nr:preprotein translocase subunit SecY [Actinomycetota bacterium]MCL6092850.1 preprotein translocase subunit SecY [Actinomycetota bacterium]MDA8166420.1 preprotein translocase subunit SecY [Actinomycetota bacterium]